MREVRGRTLRWLKTKSHALLAIAGLLAAIGCSRRADDCTYNLTCGNFDSGNSTGGQTGTTDECLTNSDCKSASRSLCSDGTCTPCISSTGCTHLTGLTHVCKDTATSDAGTPAGICVECTEAEASACGEYSCDPAKNTCTSTLLNSVKICGACVSDTECDNHASTTRCIALNYNGQFRGSYCLQQGAQVVTCPAPYKAITKSVASVSGAASDSYCGITEATTCEAVRDFASSKQCANSSDCGCNSTNVCRGGVCPVSGTMTGLCSIPCGSDANCLASAPGNTCPTALSSFCQ